MGRTTESGTTGNGHSSVPLLNIWIIKFLLNFISSIIEENEELNLHQNLLILTLLKGVKIVLNAYDCMFLIF